MFSVVSAEQWGVPVESLNIHVLSASSSRGDLLSDSLMRLRRRVWEMGARRRLLLLSCTRVLRALESRTEVCFGSGREEEAEKKKSKRTINSRCHPRGVCAASLIHEMLCRWYMGPRFDILLVT